MMLSITQQGVAVLPSGSTVEQARCADGQTSGPVDSRPAGVPPADVPVEPRRLSDRTLREVLPRIHWGFSDPPVAASETNCSRDENGQKIELRGAFMDPFKIVAFIGCPPGMPNPPPVHPEQGPLLDWHGQVIGRWWIAARLMKHERQSAEEYPLVMDVGGRRYCGKGTGIGQICRGERIPSQKVQARAEAGQYAAARQVPQPEAEPRP